MCILDLTARWWLVGCMGVVIQYDGCSSSIGDGADKEGSITCGKHK